MNKLQSIINKITSNPKMIFIIDGFGAVISAFLLGVILVMFEDTFGMPRQTLYLLALIAVGFAFY